MELGCDWNRTVSDLYLGPFGPSEVYPCKSSCSLLGFPDAGSWTTRPRVRGEDRNEVALGCFAVARAGSGVGTG